MQKSEELERVQQELVRVSAERDELRETAAAAAVPAAAPPVAVEFSAFAAAASGPPAQMGRLQMLAAGGGPRAGRQPRLGQRQEPPPLQPAAAEAQPAAPMVSAFANLDLPFSFD